MREVVGIGLLVSVSKSAFQYDLLVLVGHPDDRILLNYDMTPGFKPFKK